VGELGDDMHVLTRQPVIFDRDTMRLSIGDRSIVVPDFSVGNEAMLRSYLALVAEVRGTPIGSGIQVRHDDVVVLAEILDLADVDLEVHLANLLGVSAKDAAAVHGKLRRHRALAAAASVAISGIALLGATNISAASAPSAPGSQASHTTAISTSEPEGPPVAPTVAQAPTPPPPAASAPAPAPAAAPAPAEHPKSSDDVQIGTAMVIERGEQPADPSTQIGDTVTYER